jgi:hypothetical protein
MANKINIIVAIFAIIFSNFMYADSQAKSVFADYSIQNKQKDDNIIISFRIDDFDFGKEDLQILINALYIAKKYHIKFDLAVIAKDFDENVDPEVFKLYQNNQDVFEIVAHGYDHKKYLGYEENREFEDSPYIYQEEHMQKMKAVFEKYKLFTATKILITPFNAGDNNTIDIARKNGYIFLSQWDIPINNAYEYIKDNLIVSNAMISHPDFSINKFISKGQRRIQAVFHKPNFDMNDRYFYDTEKEINVMLRYQSVYNVKYEFISESINLKVK